MEEKEAAMVTLEGTGYYKKPAESIGDYIDRFRTLVAKAEMSDVGTIVVKFRLGLPTNVAMTIAVAGNPPASDNIDEWVARARELERQQILNRTIVGARSVSNPARPNFLNAFKKDTRPPARPSTLFPLPPAKAAGFSVLSRAPAAPGPAPVPAGLPMELDRARNNNRGPPIPNDICRRCKQPGHWAKECPLRFDIRYAMSDELEQALALARDRQEAAERHVAAAEEQEAEQEEGEDFGATSG